MMGRDTVLWLCLPPVLIAVAVMQVRGRSSFVHTFVALTLGAFAIVVLALTLFPFPTSGRYIAETRANGFGPLMSTVPLQTIRKAVANGSSTAALQVIGNALMLAPLAILLPMLRPGLARWRRIIPICFAVSCAIELVQLGVSLAMGIHYKSFDVDDILLNTVGGVVGFSVFLLGKRIVRIVRRATPHSAGGPVERLTDAARHSGDESR
jgi:glycopeptide antibiotics resistance protein